MAPGLALRVAATVVATISALALAELLVRATGLASNGSLSTMNERDFQRLPGIFSPGLRVVDRSNPALPYVITIDSLGYRGEAFPKAKGTGELRVLFAGDSFTFGAYVDDSLTVPVLLQEALRARCPTVRVVNAGIAGSTITEQAPIVMRGLSLSPDLVLLMFYDNDISDLAGTSMWQRMAINRKRKSQFPLSLAYDVLRRSAIWTLVLRSQQRLSQPQEPGSTVSSLELTNLRQRYLAILGSLRDSLEAHGVPLVVATMPSHQVVSGASSDEQMNWVARAVDSLGLKNANILSMIRGAGRTTDDLYLLPHDGHASPSGNRFIATSLANWLEALPVLGLRCREASAG